MGQMLLTGAGGGASTLGLKTNLVAWWELDEASGSRADSHTNGLTLTDNNTVTSAAGIGGVGTAALFIKANNEYLSRADTAILRVGIADFTFAFWYKRTAAYSTLGFPLSKGGQQDYSFDNNGGGMRFYTRNGGTFPTATWGSTLTTDQWYFVVGWRNGTAQTVNLQIDNGAVVSTSLGGAPVDNDTAGVFTLGAVSGGGSPTDSAMSKIGFWNTVLTSDQRTSLYNNGAGRTYAEL